MRALLRTIVLATLICVCREAAAWTDKGHKIVASLAYRRLSPAERERIVEILKQHPRYQEEFVDRMPTDARENAALKSEWLFQQAAVWPDIAREYKNANRDALHRPTWHYINSAWFLFPAERDALTKTIPAEGSHELPATVDRVDNVIQELKFARHVLRADSTATPTEKAVHLAWLFHLVGDVHQPLHSTSIYSKALFPAGDQGGNLVYLMQRTNLHALWDGFLGDRATVTEARNDALLLAAEPKFATIGDKATESLDEDVWMRESRELVLSTVYADELLAPLRKFESLEDLKRQPIGLSPEYLKAGGAVAERRVVEAGYRLGKILKEVAANPVAAQGKK